MPQASKNFDEERMVKERTFCYHITMATTTKILRLRIKDKHNKVLSQMAFEVNQVWNAANALTMSKRM